MGAPADDFSIGSLKYSMVADFAKASGFGGENSAEEIVQTAALALLFINIMEEDDAVAANNRCTRIFTFAHQRTFHGFEGEFLDFCNRLMVLGDVVMQQLGDGSSSGMVRT